MSEYSTRPISEVFVYQPPVAEKPGLAVRYLHFLERYRRWCIGFWAFMALMGMIFGLKFLANTTQVFNPPATTDSFVARVALGESFPALDGTGAIIVVAEATVCDEPVATGAAAAKFPDCTVGGASIRDDFAALNAALVTWGAAHSHPALGSVFTKPDAPCADYFTLTDDNMGLLANKLLSSVGEAAAAATGTLPRNVTIMSIGISENPGLGGTRKALVEWLQEQLLERSEHPALLQYRATGQDVFSVDIAAKAIEDIVEHDGIVLPLAILVLGIIVKSARLMIIPVVMTMVSLLVSFLFMYPVSQHMNVITFCPSIMMSATIALSIDYSLFLLSRFAEERAPPKSRGLTEAILIMIGSAGHTVAVSGSTLTLCFIGLCTFPLDLMVSLGLGASVAIIITMMVNLNLTPCVLLTFPDFFGSTNPCCCVLPGWVPFFGGGERGGSLGSSLLMGGGGGRASDEPDAAEVDDDAEEPEMKHTLWYKMGKACLGLPPYTWRAPACILGACIALVLPFAVRAFDFTASIEVSLMLPRGSASRGAFTTMQESFGDGTVFPYQLLVRPSAEANAAGCTPDSDSLFYTVNELVGNTLSKVPNTKLTGFSSAAYIGVDLGALVDNPYVKALLGNISKVLPDEPNWCGFGYAADVAARRPTVNGLFNYSWAQWALKPNNCEKITFNDGHGPYTQWGLEPGVSPDQELANLFEMFISDPNGLNATGLECFSTAFDALAAPVGADPILLPSTLPAIGVPLQQFCKATKLFNEKYIQRDPTLTRALYLDVRLGIDPYSPTGVEWLRATREAIASFEWPTNVFDPSGHKCPGGGDVFLSGAAALAEDAVSAVYDMFPTMIAATLATCFLVVGVAFRSLFVPVRAVLTIGLTLLWVYGLAVMVYIDGAFDGIGMEGLKASGSPGEINWFAPVMCFSILVGLGLDYDVFLLTRIVEFRDMGYTEKASIMMGLCKTGGIITAAGVIMAIAFSGLLFSSEAVLNQTSFYLVFAVLVDTFLIRTILVPAIMGFADTWNWYPRDVPSPVMDLLEFQSGMGDDQATELGVRGATGTLTSNSFPKLRPSRIAKIRAQAAAFRERDSHGNDLSEISGQTTIL